MAKCPRPDTGSDWSFSAPRRANMTTSWMHSALGHLSDVRLALSAPTPLSPYPRSHPSRYCLASEGQCITSGHSFARLAPRLPVLHLHLVLPSSQRQFG